VVAPAAADTPLQGITDQAAGAQVTYDDGSDVVRAATLARGSDIAIIYARDTEAEGHDRTSLSLDGNADALIAAVAAANPRTVVVLMTGSAVTMPWLSKVPAVLEAWYPGERGGHAIARLLLGAVNPSGRLPITFPVGEGQLPTAGSPQQWPGDSSHIDYTEKLLVGYRWYDARGLRPLFPFGFGLSYGGSFGYSGLRVLPADDLASLAVSDGHVRATVGFTVTNQGEQTASETPQVYVRLPAATGEPPSRLVAFSKVTLRPGESTSVRATLDDRALSYWNADAHGWRLVAGCYRTMAGSSSADLPLVGTISVGPVTCGGADVASGNALTRLPNTASPHAGLPAVVWLLILCPASLLLAARLRRSRQR
jgi:beta-glucosidase